MIRTLEFLVAMVANVWVYAGFYLYVTRIMLRIEPYQFVRTIFHELKPLYLPCVVSGYVLGSMIRNRDGWDLVLFIIAVAAYWFYKNIDKDDRWKRRKEKVLEKVEQVGSKLVSVPT